MTTLVVPKSTTPRYGHRGNNNHFSHAVEEGANTHFALVYNRRWFGLIKDKSGKLCFFAGRGESLRFMEGHKRWATTELLAVERVDSKEQRRQGAASITRIEATIEADPSVDQREKEMVEAVGLRPNQPQEGSKIDGP